MPKTHITSLLRPRGRYKTLKEQEADDSPANFINTEESQIESATTSTTPTTTTTTTTTTVLETIINNVELIPTLNFIANKPHIELQHVETICCSNNNADRIDDDDDDDSKRTYIIETTTTTDSEQLLLLQQLQQQQEENSQELQLLEEQLQQQEYNFSLATTDTSSWVDELTSSISIEMEMDNSSKITTASTATSQRVPTLSSAAATTTAATSTTTTSVEPRTSSHSAITPITPTITTSSDQSIEEDIEEAIEISEELEVEEHEEDVINSIELSEAAGGYVTKTAATDESIEAIAGGSGVSVSVNKRHHHELFGIESTDESDQISSAHDGDISKKRTNSKLGNASHGDDDDDEYDDDDDDDQFKIDVDQLSGGKLAQHFIIDDDDDNDDDYDVANNAIEPKINVDDDDDDDDDDDSIDLDISLPLEKRMVHSRHESAKSGDRDIEPPQQDSLTNQSTTDDVSELIEEPIHTEDSLQHKKENSEEVKSANANVLLVSPQHSEKDHSLGDVVMASNHTIDLTLDDKDLSSLNPSFDIHNESLVNRLLADTIDENNQKEVASTDGIKQQTSDFLNSLRNLETSQSGRKSTADLDELEIAASNKPLNEIKLIENKEAKAREVLQLQSVPEKRLITAILQPREMESLHITLDNATNVASTKVLGLSEPNSRDKKLSYSLGANDDDDDDDDDDGENSMEFMKLRILAMKLQPKETLLSPTTPPPPPPPPLPLQTLPLVLSAGNIEITSSTSMDHNASQSVKQMERISLNEFTKEVLEDITEESERTSLSTAEEQQSISMEKSAVVTADHTIKNSDNNTLQPEEKSSSNSIISLNMIKMLEQKVCDLQNMLASKDACLASLHLQLESSQRRESIGAMSATEQLGSGRLDTSSLVTNSTEYRTFQEDFAGGPTMDIYMELSKRDDLIAKLTDSLQQSLNVRENLQMESDKLSTEVQLLRKQLTEAMDTLRRPSWPRDQESNGGQRISEISMDLVSESDDDLERQFHTDNEDKYSRNSRERQFSMPRQLEGTSVTEPIENLYPIASDWGQTSQPAFSKQMEQFQKYLTPSEVRLFFMVQKKFDDYLGQELEKCKIRYENELKLTFDQLESEKLEKETEIKKLIATRQERENVHKREMEELRKYFEAKCTDLEKQYSDEVFSQKSQRHESSSDNSDQEQMPEEVAPLTRPIQSSPRKRTRAELLLSPSHRQMTPSTDAFPEDNNKDRNPSLEMKELKSFYQNKIHELQHSQDERIRALVEKLKYYECRYPDDEFMPKEHTPTTNNANTHTKAIANEHELLSPANSATSVIQHVRDANTSLIIIDQDELNLNNESQVIQKIIEEYDRRLQEQLVLAREDIVHELEHQIQTLLSETTTDDHHWPPELILLREKFTAKSQLEIAQLQIKHEEEMSRLKLEHEKQLNRKNNRHSAFDLTRNFEQLINERDNLRELSKTFRHVLAELAKCVATCDQDLNATFMDEVQRMLANNRTLEEQPQDHEFTLNLSASLLNGSFNSTKQMRFVPDVNNILDVVEDPQLLEFISSRTGDLADDFDLKECLERLRTEAAYLLQLSEDLGKHHRRHRSGSASSGAEKNDSCSEAIEEAAKLNASYQADYQEPIFKRTNSLNEQQLPTYSAKAGANKQQLLTSLPPDLNRIRVHSTSSNSIDGGNASELNFQLHELRNRLVRSESDRLKLQKELENTISRNTELGHELQTLRDQLSQFSSLNQTDFAEGYGIGSLKSPQRRLSASEKSSSSFAQLQEKARNLLNTTPPASTQLPPPPALATAQQLSNNSGSGGGDATIVLLQMIEDFCREGDKVVECNKKERDDLQAQIDAADKQLKRTRQFLDEQAAEREQERDEYVREIERLQIHLREKEKDRHTYEIASKEVEHLNSEISELTQKLGESKKKCDKFERDLKSSIDKISVLREIISDLEIQKETKALNEHVLSEKIKELEEYISSQSDMNETLKNEKQSLKIEINDIYQERIRQLEEKLQNVRPSAEQSMVLDQVVEQLRDIESTLDQKTKTLESIHYSNASNSCSTATEDVSAHGGVAASATAVHRAIVSPPQGSPVHPSPRQHSLTMEGVQRIIDKLSKHTRFEEAAVKRVHDLEQQITQMRDICVELQHERDTLQDRMSEQTQRISALQSRLEEQRQRAEDLQRAGTSDLNIRIHDLQNEVQNLQETLSARDKQIITMKSQLEKSKVAIDRLEAELAVEHQPDRSMVERLEAEVKQKTTEIQKLKDKIKSEMIHKLALPDLMETMLADKNEEIDHLKEQLESKEKELQIALEFNKSEVSLSGGAAGVVAATRVKVGAKDEAGSKLNSRTLSDIESISELDEPDIVRRAVLANNQTTPLLVPEGSGGFLQQTMETSKEAVANLTHKRTEDLSGFVTLRPVNTFEHPHYFQDPNVLMASGQSGASVTPQLVPRQINFSAFSEDSKFKTPNMQPTSANMSGNTQREIIDKLEREVEELKSNLDELAQQKEKKEKKETTIRLLQDNLTAAELKLNGLEDELKQRVQEIQELREENENYQHLQKQIDDKLVEIEELLREKEKLTRETEEKAELLTKSEKNMLNYKENQDKYEKRIKELEMRVLQTTENEVAERESLRKELKALSEIHEQCKYTLRDAEMSKKEINQLNQEIKMKDDRLHALTKKLALAEDNVSELQRQSEKLEREVEKLRQQNSDNSSKQFSVDEIAQQVEKELNYSAQLDSNILKAIESEEENNLDLKHLDKEEKQVKANEAHGTDDENFTGERELLNQLEALRAQIAVEREQNADVRQQLLAEKQHSQEIQEQDVVIIEAVRMRLETAMQQEDELQKQLDIERERCERLQTQLTALQRAESRRNSSLLLKSPTESPRKSPRSSSDFDSEVADRLRSEIKLLSAQNERERERSSDLQRSSERERQRYEMELLERVEYCEKLKKEMERVARDKDNAESECEHLQERLTLQTQEIESLEARIAALQEAETRRLSRRDRQHKETAEMLAELQEMKTKLVAADSERERLLKTITQLRYDIDRSAQREAKLAEALTIANTQLSNAPDTNVPQQFLQKMKEINILLAENTQENRNMAETVQYLVEERRQLQKKCDELEAQLSSSGNVAELEERCNQLFGRYLRVESHRKALVYQKRYLKVSLQSYQDSEQRAIAALNGGRVPPAQRDKKKLFKTVALAIIAIQRIKYIGRIWHTGKRIVSKSVFTITQQRRTQQPPITCAATSTTMPTSPGSAFNQYHHQQQQLYGAGKFLERSVAPLKSPALINDAAIGMRTTESVAPPTASSATNTNAFVWPHH